MPSGKEIEYTHDFDMGIWKEKLLDSNRCTEKCTGSEANEFSSNEHTHHVTSAQRRKWPAPQKLLSWLFPVTISLPRKPVA